MLKRISWYFFAFGIFLCLLSLIYGFTNVREINYANPDVTSTFAYINHNNNVINISVELIMLGVLSVGSAALISFFVRKSHRTYWKKSTSIEEEATEEIERMGSGAKNLAFVQNQ